MKFGVVVFPGTWSDRDCGWVVDQILGEELRYLWHRDPDLYDSDCVILPGGFSYGDHLRCGAIARFSPIMESVVDFAGRGGLVWGICNGFQVLCEAGLLPGALIRNDSLEFRCQWTDLRVERSDLPWTRGLQRGEVIRVPISHGEGNYFADPETLDRLEANGQVVFRYTDPKGEMSIDSNPNGSARAIAGIVNDAGNVLGMMPHPERCAEDDLGGADGLRLFLSLVGAGDKVAAR